MSAQVRHQVPGIEARRQRNFASRLFLSPVEIAVGSIVVLFFFGVLFYYFSSLKPEQQKLARLEEQQKSEKQFLIGMISGAGVQPVRNTAKDALDSLEAFKTRYLRPQREGQRALIDEINALVKKHNARLTSGLAMSLENTGEDLEKKKSKSKNAETSLSVFPKLNITFTIAGQYENLRSFISELERNKQFIVIHSLNFTTVEDSGEGEGGRRGRRATVSGLVLSVNLAAHFQP